MVVFRCINCGAAVNGFEGEHGTYHGRCNICGFGHGNYKTNYTLLEKWEDEQKAREPVRERSQIPESYYIRIPDYDNGCPVGPFQHFHAAIDWYYTRTDIRSDATLEREYEVLRRLTKKNFEEPVSGQFLQDIEEDILNERRKAHDSE